MRAQNRAILWSTTTFLQGRCRTPRLPYHHHTWAAGTWTFWLGGWSRARRWAEIIGGGRGGGGGGMVRNFLRLPGALVPTVQTVLKTVEILEELSW